MAFESLSQKLTSAFKKLRGKGKLSEEDIKLAMREVRIALLEADVNMLVAKDFIKTVSCIYLISFHKERLFLNKILYHIFVK